MGIPRVTIVGGGPAGCAAAYTLAKESINVTVFERGHPGKDKACGDALGPLATDLVGRFGINQERIKVLGGHYHDRLSLRVDKLLVRQTEFKSKAGWVIPRAVIDQEIRNVTAEYALFRYDTRVTALTIEPTGSFKLSLVYENGWSDEAMCDAVILATGSANQLSKKLGIDANLTEVLRSHYMPRCSILTLSHLNSSVPANQVIGGYSQSLKRWQIRGFVY